MARVHPAPDRDRRGAGSACRRYRAFHAGYDHRSGLFLEPTTTIPAIPDHPTIAELHAARDLLLDLVCDFPFEREAHRSSWLAYLLTALSRFAFDGPAPLFLVDANVRGSGKTLLAEIIGLIVTGRKLARTSNPRDDEESRKRITALALCGDSLVLIDNVDGELGSASLDAALTGTVWKDRRLGVSEMIELPLTLTWAATGNNVILAVDTSRRVCHVRLRSRLESPEERQGFKYPEIERHVRENRMRYVAAALTILRGYYAEGQPDQQLKPWGSFEEWSAGPRSAVVWCGLADPGDTRQELRQQADRSAMALRGLLEGWEELDADGTGITTGAAWQVLEKRPDEYGLLREALVELCNTPAGKLPSTSSLGNRLRSVRGRIIGGKAIECRPGRGGYAHWFVQRVGEDQSRGR